MATVTVRGGAVDVKQVGTIQITGDDGGTTYTITVGAGNNTHAVSVLGSGTGVNDTATALQVACAASTHPYFVAILFEVATDTVTLTATTAGCEFVAVSSVADAAGTIGAYSVVTANTGTNDLNNVDNYDGAAVVASSDTLYFGVGCPPMTTGLDQSAKTSVVLHHPRGAGNVGLQPQAFATSPDGNTVDISVPEYRATYLDIDCTTIDIGAQAGPSLATGATGIRINNSRGSANLSYVHSVAGTSVASGVPTLNMQFNHADADIEIKSAVGGIGIGIELPTQTFTLGEIDVTGATGASKIYVGGGVTWSKYTHLSGNAFLENANGTSANVFASGGSVTCRGVWGIKPNLTAQDGGLIKWTAPLGALKDLTAYGTIDLSGVIGTLTVDTLTWFIGGAVIMGDNRPVFTTMLFSTDGSQKLSVTKP